MALVCRVVAIGLAAFGALAGAGLPPAEPRRGAVDGPARTMRERDERHAPARRLEPPRI